MLVNIKEHVSSYGFCYTLDMHVISSFVSHSATMISQPPPKDGLCAGFTPESYILLDSKMAVKAIKEKIKLNKLVGAVNTSRASKRKKTKLMQVAAS